MRVAPTSDLSARRKVSVEEICARWTQPLRPGATTAVLTGPSSSSSVLALVTTLHLALASLRNHRSAGTGTVSGRPSCRWPGRTALDLSNDGRARPWRGRAPRLVLHLRDARSSGCGAKSRARQTRRAAEPSRSHGKSGSAPASPTSDEGIRPGARALRVRRDTGHQDDPRGPTRGIRIRGRASSSPSAFAWTAKSTRAAIRSVPPPASAAIWSSRSGGRAWSRMRCMRRSAPAPALHQGTRGRVSIPGGRRSAARAAGGRHRHHSPDQHAAACGRHRADPAGGAALQRAHGGRLRVQRRARDGRASPPAARVYFAVSGGSDRSVASTRAASTNRS